MAYRYLFLLIILSITCLQLTSHGEPPPQKLPETKQASPQSQPNDQPPSFDDLENSNRTTPEKATISFTKLYNGILPSSPVSDLQAICTKSTAPSYHSACLKILEKRLSYLKSIAVKVKGAMFRYQPPSILTTSPMKLKANWQEKLTFFDGTTEINEKSMLITLHKLDRDWTIIKVEQ